MAGPFLGRVARPRVLKVLILPNEPLDNLRNRSVRDREAEDPGATSDAPHVRALIEALHFVRATNPGLFLEKRLQRPCRRVRRPPNLAPKFRIQSPVPFR